MGSIITINRLFSLLLSATVFSTPARALQQDEAVAGSASEAAGQETRIFVPEEFARFAPRNALDMLEEVPGFRIEGEDNGSRGLGQASGNVLINGQRLSSKSEGARDQLRKISIDNVLRIEIVDGTALDLPGLTGQVANVVVTSGGVSGQFGYAPQIRAIGDNALLDGSVSLSGSSGGIDYTLALENDDDPGASRGTILRYDSTGALLERRYGDSLRNRLAPQISATLGWTDGEGTIANLNASHRWTWFDNESTEVRTRSDGDNPLLVNGTSSNAFVRYEIGGDVAFPVFGGQLKLIGLARGDDADFVSDQIVTDRITAISGGARYAQLREAGERIGRAEFGWSDGWGDWQIAGEAAFNQLDQVASLFDIDADGSLIPIEFPEGVGGVSEDRYEASISYGRVLSDTLSLQAILGAEQSQLTQTGAAAASRSFFRPKGSLALAWSPRDDLDLDLSLRRRVGQLSFGDFLAQVFLGDERENAGNSQLRPPQSWELELQARKDFGRWGNATLRLFDHYIEDLVDVILVDGGESPGNIASARRTGVGFNGTLELAPLGLEGAKIDADIDWLRARLNDPLTGLYRPISGTRPTRFDFDYRHDIPGSNIAYGGGLFLNSRAPFFRITEFGNNYDGPVFGSFFVEHKDLLGLTVNARLGNPFGGRDLSTRTVFDGPRNTAPILFVEERNRRFGPNLRISVSGSF